MHSMIHDDDRYHDFNIPLDFVEDNMNRKLLTIFAFFISSTMVLNIHCPPSVVLAASSPFEQVDDNFSPLVSSQMQKLKTLSTSPKKFPWKISLNFFNVCIQKLPYLSESTFYWSQINLC